MPATTTLTSASTNTSTPIALDWMGGKPVILSVIATSQSSGAFTIQYTMDDLQRSSSPTWVGLSSGWSATFPSVATTGTIFNASSAYPDGVSFALMASPAALRLTSTATNNVNDGPITMRVLQGVGG